MVANGYSHCHKTVGDTSHRGYMKIRFSGHSNLLGSASFPERAAESGVGEWVAGVRAFDIGGDLDKIECLDVSGWLQE
jgi:hypothetical protein